MKKNIGGMDQMIRILAGICLILSTILGLIGPWGFIGILPLVTGFFSVCPLYSILNINTLGNSKNDVTKKQKLKERLK